MLKWISLLGSAFVKRGQDGSVEIAAVPSGLLVYALSGAACDAQTSELFSVCMERLLPLVGGIF